MGIFRFYIKNNIGDYHVTPFLVMTFNFQIPFSPIIFNSTFLIFNSFLLSL